MIRLSNLADYAVVLMSHIALRPDHIYPATEISGETGIPAPTVSKILGMLVKAKLLTSHRGLNGGFSLNGQADEITIADIIEAVDGPVQLTNCLDEVHSDCDYQSNCCTRSKWSRINAAVKAALNSVALSEMVAPVPDFLGPETLDPDTATESGKRQEEALPGNSTT
ncbi:SUF system Fe-S cluster assembly regulator [Luteithermobacter gelatinilyticus]|uniref:SUF system Fe-S cluster assembly regulator n=1 Tax=Luteithermobacter gelatinilyticus TaxID=2582913 RepID=UPI0011064E8D|nr:SUF system Fe-S cluster assembly regulator [Luteithermobacter gelatinilyticus]